MNKILLIGCGHMGNALLRSWFLNTNYSFIIIDPLQYKKINKEYASRVKAYKSLDIINPVF